jgi:death on curing protein
LGYGIAINHPFVDGNKRTAFIVMAVFLKINQVRLIASEIDVVSIMLGIASGTTSEKMLCNWLKENTET